MLDKKNLCTISIMLATSKEAPAALLLRVTSRTVCLYELRLRMLAWFCSAYARQEAGYGGLRLMDTLAAESGQSGLRQQTFKNAVSLEADLERVQNV